MPTTRSKYNRYASGLSTHFLRYYSSGFLSLQLAVDDQILRAAGGEAGLPSAYAFPFPIAAYAHNPFFDFAGNLVGLVVCFSFLVPVSSLLKTLVLERELKLREQLYMMGLRPVAYYGATLITNGATFMLIGLVAAVEVGLSTYPHSSLSLVAFLFVEFALSTLAFTLALSPLFRNARVAALIGPLAYFLTSQPYNFFLDRGVLIEGMAGAKAYFSLLPTMGFYLAAALLSLYEGAGHGVTWATVGAGGPFPISSSLLMLTLSIPLYLALAWYLDAVVPSSEGTQKPWWFVFRRSRRHARGMSPRADGDDDGATTAAADPLATTLPQHAVEPLPEPVAGRGVATLKLRREFGRATAVNDLTLDMPVGYITALLGPNGAGKTTTISVLTGLLPPTSGDATIDGLSILTDMERIRASLGVCPQANTLFDALTPTQHLRLYGELRGMRGALLEEAIAAALSRVDLAGRAHAPASALSGGQKRKLCLSIALFGDARIVFLDEPTSGMDPSSRRAVWSMLREARAGRTVALTTHFLDEAEILADRIAILTEGTLRCVGSPPFLKASFGVGHTLSVVKGDECVGASSLSALARDCGVAGASVHIDGALTASIRLPGQDLKALLRTFEAVENRQASLGVKEFGVECTTLEDVFLKIITNDGAIGAETASSAAEKPADELDGAASWPVNLAPDASEELGGDARRRGGGCGSLFLALVAKRRHTARRDLYTTVCSFLCPILLVLLSLLLIGYSSKLINPGPRLALVPESTIDTSASPELRVPLLLADGSAGWASGLAVSGWEPETLAACPETNLSAAACLSDHLAAHQNGPAPAAFAVAEHLESVPLPPALAKLLDGALDSLLVLLFNSTSTHALPTLLASAHDALLRNQTGGDATLNVAIEALPFSKWEESRLTGFVALFGSILIIIPFAFVGALFVSPLLREVNSGFKQQQFISGTGALAYWGASWAWDALLFAGVVCASLAVFALATIFAPAAADAFAGTPQATLATTLAISLFGVAVVPLASVASFGFRVPSSGLIFLIAFHFLSGFGLIVTDFILSNIDTTRAANKSLKGLYRVFPAYCLGESFYIMASRSAFETIGVPPPPLFSSDQLGAPLLYLALEGVALCALTLALQFYAARKGRPRARTPAMEMERKLAELTAAGLEDESVLAERRAIDAGAVPELLSRGGLVLAHLRKVYPAGGGNPEKVAVADLCLRVEPGECFGLLGTNGAGKSTTFKMLTGAEPPSAGDAAVGSLSASRDQAHLRRVIGYCPQHDALDPLLTGRETLRLFAAIKHAVPRDVAPEVDALVRELDLTKHADKPVGAYSGGNKRKLCVAAALVGSPSLVLLDEPSSGMDAGSKRFLWSVLRRRTARATALLTTHSMEECEALCSRIGVMVDGALRCVGPIQTLKSRYGDGMRLLLRLNPEGPRADEVCDWFRARCDGVRVDEVELPNLTLTVPSAPISSLFRLLVAAREEVGVCEASVTMCTLEQVFLVLARKRNLDGGVVRQSHGDGDSSTLQGADCRAGSSRVTTFE